MRQLRIVKRLSLFVSALLLGSFLVAPAVHAASGYQWTNDTTGTALSGNNWGAVASSESGNFIVAADTGGADLYASRDYGTTWTDLTAGTTAANQTWGNKDLSMSASGHYITAMTLNGDVWNSNNYGATWTNRTAGTSLSGQNWQQSATSSTGQYVAATDYHDIFVSSDYGIHWTKKTTGSLGGRDWSKLSMSATGQYIYAIYEDYSGGGDNAYLYGSANYGATWTKLTGDPSLNSLYWYNISASANGQNLVAGVWQGDIYTSSDYGKHWTNRTAGTALSGLSWYGLTSSGSGQYIVALSNQLSGPTPASIYASRDYGATWTDLTPSAPLNAVFWESVALSASGQHILAGSDNLYTANDPSLAPPKPHITSKTVNVHVNGSVTVNTLAGVSGIDPATFAIVSKPHHGKAVDPPGDITYTPNSGFSGTDSVAYRVCALYDDTVCSQASLNFTVSLSSPDTGYGVPGYDSPFATASLIASLAATTTGMTLFNRRKTPRNN